VERDAEIAVSFAGLGMVLNAILTALVVPPIANDHALAAARRRDMSIRLLRSLPLLAVSLALLVTGGTGAEAEEGPELYPGQHVAGCKPAPIAGCVCNTDALGKLSIFPVSVNDANGTDRIEDAERLRLVDWLRRTCMALTQGANSR
jgi:hypothetical protein